MKMNEILVMTLIVIFLIIYSIWLARSRRNIANELADEKITSFSLILLCREIETIVRSDKLKKTEKIEKLKSMLKLDNESHKNENYD